MSDRKNGITICLTIGKEVKLRFDSENYLSSIRLSINKVAELFGNNIVNEKSIFDVTTVALITQSNYKTYISVDSIQSMIKGDAVYEEVSIDQKKTRAKKGNENVFTQGHFEFFVSEQDKIPKNKVVFPFPPRK